MIELTAEWLAANPLPQPGQVVDKNSRGRLLVAGGSLRVPGALLLTGEAGLRAGAGKVQLATVEPAALALGVAFPEAAVICLSTNDRGELAGAAGVELEAGLSQADALIIGPGMGHGAEAGDVLSQLLGIGPNLPMVLDAATLRCVGPQQDALSSYAGPLVLTPHPAEMSAILSEDSGANYGQAEEAARRFQATIVFKSIETWVASPDGGMIHYRGGGPGLATAGSGDVLAGIIGGLLARGASPSVAAAWGVWLHGECGRRCADTPGRIGFLARDLLPWISILMNPAAKIPL